jgi:uncharacterized SAM-binding protein YcdF (DUF218 family)
MFFYLSKLLTFLISPTIIILILLTGAYISNKAMIRRRLLLSALALLILFSNPFIIGKLSGLWEVDDVGYNKTKHYNTAIVLSGFMSKDEDLNRLTFGASVDRLTESLILYRNGQVDNILISGGSGSIIKDSRESSLAKAFLVNYCAVPDSVILIDTISRNTYENAVESKKIMEKHHIKSALLITSAFHMRRSKGCFDRQNIKTDTYSIDVSGKQEYHPSALFIPNTGSIGDWEVLLHEIIGVIMYKVKGYM